MAEIDIKAELRPGDVILLLVNRDKYKEQSGQILKSLAKGAKSICYISLISNYKQQIKNLDGLGLNKNNFFIIDGISTGFKKEQPPNSVSAMGLSDILSLSFTTLKEIETRKFDAVVIDDFSALFLYNNWKDVLKFLQALLIKIRNKETGTLIFYTKDSKYSEYANDVYLFVDKVMSVG